MTGKQQAHLAIPDSSLSSHDHRASLQSNGKKAADMDKNTPAHQSSAELSLNKCPQTHCTCLSSPSVYFQGGSCNKSQICLVSLSLQNFSVLVLAKNINNWSAQKCNNQCVTLAPNQHTPISTNNILIGNNPEGVCGGPKKYIYMALRGKIKQKLIRIIIITPCCTGESPQRRILVWNPVPAIPGWIGGRVFLFPFIFYPSSFDLFVIKNNFKEEICGPTSLIKHYCKWTCLNILQVILMLSFK